MWREGLDAIGHAESAGVRVHHERAENVLAFVGKTGEHDVVIRDPGIGDERFLAVQRPSAVDAPRGRAHGGDVGSGLSLGQGERSDALPLPDTRQISRLQLVGAVQRYRSRSQPLHREREVRQAGELSQRLATQTQRAHVEFRARAPVQGRHAEAQPTTLAELPHDRAAQRVDVVSFIRLVVRRDLALRP